jgi:hypothetical protein
MPSWGHFEDIGEIFSFYYHDMIFVYVLLNSSLKEFPKWLYQVLNSRIAKIQFVYLLYVFDGLINWHFLNQCVTH